MNKTMRIIFVMIFAASALLIRAEPNGPSDLSILNSETGVIGDAPPQQISAQAGNITGLVMNVTTITKTWQGYFGNISGKISLDDANNWTLYDWEFASPQGRIYAARNESIVWVNISCMRFDADGSLYPNLTTEQVGYLGGSLSDGDSIDKTFAVANHSDITIGTVVLPENTCNTTFLYVNDTSQNTQFREVLLTDNSSNNSVIYTAILEQDVVGFNNKSMDFQMIVGENGHGNNDATLYYFWVELV